MADKELRELFGKNLRHWLSVNGYKQADLCERFSISSATVSDWCNGKKMPRADKLKAICTWLGIELSDLITDVEKSRQLPEYYINHETAEIAQELFENKELHALFSVQRDMDPEDLRALHNMALALKRKERYNGDDPA